jgi:L-threonylcarbamoyladenylate synthase
MLTLPLKENNHSEVFKKALTILESGEIVAYPTESFYALGVIATDSNAVKRLFELKKRPAEKPLPIIVGNMDILGSIVKSIPEQAKALIEKFWPGPLTLIFEAADNIPESLTGGTGKVAVRIPGRSAALYLAEAIKFPITATSANPSSLPPAETPDAVINYFGDKVDLIVDAGRAPGGKPSTIIDVTVDPPKILREGRIQLRPMNAKK